MSFNFRLLRDSIDAYTTASIEFTIKLNPQSNIRGNSRILLKLSLKNLTDLPVVVFDALESYLCDWFKDKALDDKGTTVILSKTTIELNGLSAPDDLEDIIMVPNLNAVLSPFINSCGYETLEFHYSGGGDDGSYEAACTNQSYWHNCVEVSSRVDFANCLTLLEQTIENLTGDFNGEVYRSGTGTISLKERTITVVEVEDNESKRYILKPYDYVETDRGWTCGLAEVNYPYAAINKCEALVIKEGVVYIASSFGLIAHLKVNDTKKITSVAGDQPTTLVTRLKALPHSELNLVNHNLELFADCLDLRDSSHNFKEALIQAEILSRALPKSGTYLLSSDFNTHQWDSLTQINGDLEVKKFQVPTLNERHAYWLSEQLVKVKAGDYFAVLDLYAEIARCNVPAIPKPTLEPSHLPPADYQER